ncbi:A coat protein [Stenotrophomonas sp. HITSZ_GD]|uniref:A coat protein n=1 Tax=Stenotrophomonas sp. HITSZ_GD TaxID=3037248 RepID=UPI00240D0751|nr:A coat protein [Stenotrophomonas sp. HITSZ_GD]MDG2524217.1 A coat protein [Stenotrophomonas sp. HITSZ_GD]
MRKWVELMNGLGRYFVRAMVRRIAYGAAALLIATLLHLCTASEARAAVDCFNTSVLNSGCGDQGEATSAVVAVAARWVANKTAAEPPPYTQYKYCAPFDSGVQMISVFIPQSSTCPTTQSAVNAITNKAIRSYSGKCADRNSARLADAALNYSAPATCISGCKVQGTAFTKSVGSVMQYGMKDRSYTGETCSPQVIDANAPITQEKSDDARVDATTPKSPECTALGNGQTGCVKPNGDYCATASTGKTFCWTPGETGKKTDGTDAQVKSPKGDPVTPPSTTITDQEWQRKEGHQVAECTGSACTTSNVTNYTSVPSGTAKNSSGDNNADGSGNTTGNGKADDGKKGDDDSKDSASDSGNCDAPPVCVGDTLKCLQLKFTWKIQCNTQGNEISNGNGCGEGDVPVCAGKSCKAEAYAQVIQQWKQRCAFEALGQGNAERAAGISNGDDAGVVEGIWNGESGGSGMTLRQDLVSVGGGGGSLLPDVEIEGQHWNVPQGFYDAIAAVRMVIIAMCTVIAMFVVGRNI